MNLDRVWMTILSVITGLSVVFTAITNIAKGTSNFADGARRLLNEKTEEEVAENRSLIDDNRRLLLYLVMVNADMPLEERVKAASEVIAKELTGAMTIRANVILAEYEACVKHPR